ncbi:MAG: Dyp-type peroxidase [Candidatus Eremiobacteraeota bacterium]|nr:Dyp-type peroxidase [Candidatus Eremiobacteraeota bacterium]
MAHSQAGIFSLGDPSQAHFELNVRSPERAKELAGALMELERPHSTVSGVNLVVGFRPSLWRELMPARAIDARDFDRPIVGADGFTMPATQRDVWLWFTGASYDVIFDQARVAVTTLSKVAEVAFELTGWSYRHSRDLTGFEDGTANPSLLEAADVTLVADGEPGAGSTIALLQQWRHRTREFDHLSEAQQEDVIGRTKAASDELPPERMPGDSHVARTELHDAAGDELPIFRRSVPYGNVGDHGLMFVGFAREQGRLDTMLRQMAGMDGPRDALTRFSTPLTGAYYVVPSLEALRELSDT